MRSCADLVPNIHVVLLLEHKYHYVMSYIECLVILAKERVSNDIVKLERAFLFEVLGIPEFKLIV